MYNKIFQCVFIRNSYLQIEISFIFDYKHRYEFCVHTYKSTRQKRLWTVHPTPNCVYRYYVFAVNNYTYGLIWFICITRSTVCVPYIAYVRCWCVRVRVYVCLSAVYFGYDVSKLSYNLKVYVYSCYISVLFHQI